MLLTWDKPDERYYEHGLDRGVLYIPGRDPIPWNGLTSFDEGSGGSTSVLYRDGVIYLADVDPGDFSAQLGAIYYPDAFGECLGIPEAADGFFVDAQKPKRFGLSYRSLVGSGTKGDMFGYQIHLVYNAMASIGTRNRKTIGDQDEPMEFSFDLVCTPVQLPGFRPSAHYVIDTRTMSPSKITQLEDILYGSGVTPGSLPDPVTFFDIMNYGAAITVTDHGDGTFSVDGSNDNVFMTDSMHFQLNNINSTAPDVNGEYVISDGGDTTVVVG